MTLTWRLIISYVVIIATSLVLAFLTLVLVARPIQTRLARARLGLQSQAAASRIDNLYRQGVTTAALLARLRESGEPARLRLVITDPGGRVLADSGGEWLGQQLQPSAGDEAGPRLETFEDPAGRAYMYVMAPLKPNPEGAGYVAVATPGLPALAAALGELGWGFIVAGLVTLLIGLLLSVLIARSIALPLQRIATAAGIAAAGDHPPRLEETGPPEIRRVAASFNTMVGRVEAGQQAMRDFVSNVSHELKTPLTSIQGFSQALLEGATQDEEGGRRAAQIINEEAGRMARLVADLLDLARIDAGQAALNLAPLNLDSILASTADRLLPQAAQKGVSLARQWADLPPVVGDGDRLAQVFTNLLDNAIRHTPAGGRVMVSSAITRGPSGRPRRARPEAAATLPPQADFVEISVADTGPGISPAELSRIFERFYQVDKSRKRSRGTGLGLAITREIVEAHGGAVRAESLEGVGSKFTVILPCQ